MPHSNVRRIRRFLDALNRRDLKACLEFLDPEVEWHWMDWGPLSGVHSGPEGMKTILEQLRTEAWELFRIECDEIDYAGSRVLVLGGMRGPGGSSAGTTDITIAWLITLVQGAIVRVLSYSEQDKARHALERYRNNLRR
jgi:ketosteroid isomerase-like protein